MKKSKLALLALGSICFITTTHALEPLESSTDSKAENLTTRLLEKFDSNKDKKIQKTEDEKTWKRNAKFDQNKDQALDSEELKQSFAQTIDSPGKHLLNVLYKKTPQGDLHLDIFSPDEDTSTSKPVVFFTHGGGWAAGNKSKASSGSFAEVHKAWLKEGFTVVSIGYRLTNKSRSTSIRDCVIDCKDAMRFVSGHKEALGIDPNKFYTFGDSAGGHLAMMLLHTKPEILTGDTELEKFSYKTVAGVSWYGPCDFQDIQLFNHDDRPNFNDRFGARIMAADSKPEDKVTRYKEMSPVNHLTENSAPLLMIQGNQDTTIPVKQAYRMQEALKTIKAPVEIMIIENAGHNWRSVKAPIKPTREEIVKHTIDFIVRHEKMTELK